MRAVVCGMVLAASACANVCSSKTCGGCCDAQGVCQSGVTVDACGEAGATCGRCGTTTTCVRGLCEAGSAGVDAGTGATCRNIPSFPSAQSNVIIADYWSFMQSVGHYNVVRFSTPHDALVDGLGIEVVYPNDQGPTLPVTRSLTGTYRTCDVCSVYYESCNQAGDCQKTYLARSGSVTVSRADRNAASGRIAGSASNLRFVDWNLTTDMAASTACITVDQVPTFSVGWNHDGGSPPP